MIWAVLALTLCASGTESTGDRAPTLPPPHYTLLGYPALSNPITVHFDPTGSPLPAGQTIAVWREALAEWSTAGLEFQEQEAASGAKIRLSWKPRAHDGCPDGYGWDRNVAHSGLRDGVRFVHFLQDEKWSLRGEEHCGLLQATLHEVGHALGIGHSADPQSVMYSAYQKSMIRIGTSDRAALETLTGRRSDPSVTRPGDLWQLEFDPSGRPTGRHLLAAAAAEGRLFTTIDIDGDNRDELLTWPRKFEEERGFIAYRFRAPGQVETVGPLPYVVDTNYEVTFGRTKPNPVTGSKGRAVLVHRFPGGRYRASVFDQRRVVPIRPYPPDRPLDLDTGVCDLDANGVLERERPSFRGSPSVPLPDGFKADEFRANGFEPVAEADLDRDGQPDLLFYNAGTSRARWLLSAGSASYPGAPRLGPLFPAVDPVLSRQSTHAAAPASNGSTQPVIGLVTRAVPETPRRTPPKKKS